MASPPKQLLRNLEKPKNREKRKTKAKTRSLGDAIRQDGHTIFHMIIPSWFVCNAFSRIPIVSAHIVVFGEFICLSVYAHVVMVISKFV